jgi:hypothetical protein
MPLIKYKVMTYEGMEVLVYLHVFLTSPVDGSEWSVSRSGRLIPEERIPSTHCMGGRMDPRAVYYPSWESNRDILVKASAVTILAELFRASNLHKQNNLTIWFTWRLNFDFLGSITCSLAGGYQDSS